MGTRRSHNDGADVTVDREFFGHERNRFAIRNEVYTLEQLREETRRRWGMFESGEVIVDNPGWLAPGIHKLEVCTRPVIPTSRRTSTFSLCVRRPWQPSSCRDRKAWHRPARPSGHCDRAAHRLPSSAHRPGS